MKEKDTAFLSGYNIFHICGNIYINICHLICVFRVKLSLVNASLNSQIPSRNQTHCRRLTKAKAKAVCLHFPRLASH